MLKRALVVVSLSLVFPLLNCGGGSSGSSVTNPPPPPPPSCVNTATVACTQSGQVQGVIEGNLRAFRGIPYAAPPVGNLRWKAPAAPASWQGVRDASQIGNVCPQLDGSGALFGDEDCLLVNVYTSSPAPSTPQPVMVFLHGGGNVGGDTRQPKFDSPPLATQGAVVVWVQYRLGILGFLANPLLTSEGGGTSGNYALLDMIAALKWVQQNISNFGGDPNHVLLWGQSSGSWDIQMLLAAPSAQGLFSAAAMESGVIPSTATAKSLPTFAATEAASTPFVSAMGCDQASDVLACLRALSPGPIVNYQQQSPLPVLPGVGSPFLPEDSFTAIQQNGSPVPLLIGSTREEYTNSGDNPNTPLDQTGYSNAVHAEFDPIGAGVADQVLTLYPATNYDAPIYALVAVDTDYHVSCETQNLALAAAGSGRPNVYRFLYTHQFEDDPSLKAGRAFHTAELYFLFGNMALIDPSFTSAVVNYVPTVAEVSFSQQMMGYWIRFAATGNPNGNGAVNWPAYDATSENILQLDDTPTITNGYDSVKCQYFSTLPQP